MTDVSASTDELSAKAKNALRMRLSRAAKKNGAKPKTPARSAPTKPTKPAKAAKPVKAAKVAKPVKAAPVKRPAKAITAKVENSSRRPAAEQSTKDIALAMLKRPQGASAAELQSKTQWLLHTARAWISTYTRKHNLNLTSEREEGRGRVYKVTD